MNNKLEVCKQCANYNNETHRCSVCKCYMPIKVHVPFASCPIDKW